MEARDEVRLLSSVLSSAVLELYMQTALSAVERTHPGEFDLGSPQILMRLKPHVAESLLRLVEQSQPPTGKAELLSELEKAVREWARKPIEPGDGGTGLAKVIELFPTHDDGKDG